MPPNGALTWPSSEVPAPKAMTGTPEAAQSVTMSLISAVDLRPHHRVGRQPGVHRLAAAVLLAHRLAGATRVAEARGEFCDDAGDEGRIDAGRCLPCGAHVGSADEWPGGWTPGPSPPRHVKGG